MLSISITKYNDAYFIKLRFEAVKAAPKDGFISDFVNGTITKWLCVYGFYGTLYSNIDFISRAMTA